MWKPVTVFDKNIMDLTLKCRYICVPIQQTQEGLHLFSSSCGEIIKPMLLHKPGQRSLRKNITMRFSAVCHV